MKNGINLSLQILYFLITVILVFVAFDLKHYAVLLVSALSVLFSFVPAKAWDKKYKLKYWAACLLSIIIIFITILIEVGIEMRAT